MIAPSSEIPSESPATTQSAVASTTTVSQLLNQDIFLNVSAFLRLSEMSALMRVNHQMLSNSQEYFRQHLHNLKLLSDTQFNESTTTNYWNIYRKIYHRDVLFTNISAFPIDRTSVEDLRVFRSRSQKRLFNIGISKFSIGTKFTAFLTHDHTLYYCKTSEYFTAAESLDSFEYIKRDNVAKFSTSPRNFIYLTNAGTVHIVFHDDEKPTTALQETLLEWTLDIPVTSMKASYAMVAFIINANSEQTPFYSSKLSKLVAGQDYKAIHSAAINSSSNQQIAVNDTKLNVVVYHVNELIPEDVNNPVSDNIRYKRIAEYPFATVLSFAVGYHQLILVGEDHRCYTVDLSNYVNIGGITPNVLPVKLVEHIGLKHVSKVFSGFASFFAYSREEIKPMQDWNTQQLIEFFSQFEEFHDYINIVKYEGITGADLININKKFMKDRLGMIRDELQLKLLTEINKYRESTYKPEKLYGWGKNDSGQLGLSKSTNINQPTRIDLPTLDESDEVEVIKIGWKNSVLVTKNRRIFITENRERKQEKKAASEAKIDEQDADEEEYKESSRGAKKSKKAQQRKQSGAIEESTSGSTASQSSSSNQKSNSNSSKSKNQHNKQSHNSGSGSNNHGNNNSGSNNNNSSSSGQSTSASQSGSSAAIEEQNKSRWIEITHRFAELKDKRKYELIEVSCAKDTVCVLGNCYETKRMTSDFALNHGDSREDKHNHGSEEDEEDSKKKLTPVLAILKRIKWDPALNQDEYTIVYQDRFLKDLEIDFVTFEDSDAKSYRIRQIKRNNKVVWDREKKFDDISK